MASPYHANSEIPGEAYSLDRALAGLGAGALRHALDASAIVVVTDRNGVIVDCNKKFIDVSGFSREELIGSTHSLVNSGFHDREFFVNLYRTIGSGAIWRGTIRNRRKDGSLYWVDTTIVPKLDRKGRPKNYIAIRFEVTDHIMALQALEEAKAEAERAARLRDRFLANMSHEVRTPLNGVLGLASAIRRSDLAPGDLDKVDLILSCGQSLRRILDDVLDLTKIQAGEMRLNVQPYAPAAEVGGAIELMRELAESKGLALRVAAEQGLPAHVMGDASRIRQIVLNLVSNAVKFTVSGTVSVSVVLRGRGDRRWLKVRVQDTGPGFDRQVAAKLFHPFFQEDSSISREFGGTGLGLSISSELAALMGGNLRVRSSPGRGSLFVFSLPFQPAQVEMEVPQEDRTPSTTLGPLNILLVEDNRVNQQVVCALLETLDVRIDIASNGAEGVERWCSGRYDIVLMDMQMPVMDGLEAIRRIRAEERTRGAACGPIAMLTANASDWHRDQALEAGADMVIAKPITAETLLNGLASIAA